MRFLVLLFCLSIGPLVRGADGPLNFLFIVWDDFSATALGTYGNEVCQTPNLNRLVKEGLRFDRAYGQFPVCGATRKTATSYASDLRVG